MKPKLPGHGNETDRVDVAGLARVGLLIGALVAVAGALQQNPVLRSMAEAYDVRPALSAGQTLGIGLALFVASVIACVRGARSGGGRR